MTPTDRRVDWEGVKACIAALSQLSPSFLTQSVLIGGGACWFYRIQLRNAKDPDFREQGEAEEAQDLWLSKDIDFTGIFRGDAFEMLPRQVVTDSSGNSYLQVAGVRIGFAQVGVTFDPEEVLSKARLGSFKVDGQNVQFLVIDPISLYREKQALSQKRNSPNDHAHFSVLKEFLAIEFVQLCSAYLQGFASVVEQQQNFSLLIDFKNRALEIAQDSRVRLRLAPLLSSDRPETKWAKSTFQL